MCAGLNAHPTDYLQFFAPGNRESQRPDEPAPEKKAPGGGGAELAQLTRRFMIYVHSKMMIVDDEVSCAFLKSQRSCSGTLPLRGCSWRAASWCARTLQHDGCQRRGVSTPPMSGSRSVLFSA